MAAIRTDGTGRAVAFAPSGEMLACGLNNGGVMILDTVNWPPSLRTLSEVKDSEQWIQVLKFDPSGDFLKVMWGTLLHRFPNSFRSELHAVIVTLSHCCS